jgi:hypothetical protein
MVLKKTTGFYFHLEIPDKLIFWFWSVPYRNKPTIFVLNEFMKKMLHLGANRIKLNVFQGVCAFGSPFPHTFQQNC